MSVSHFVKNLLHINKNTTQLCKEPRVTLSSVGRELKQNCKETQYVLKRYEDDVQVHLDNLFDIANADDLERIDIDEDKEDIHTERKRTGSPELFSGCRPNLVKKEKRQGKYEETKDGERREVFSDIAANTSTTQNILL